MIVLGIETSCDETAIAVIKKETDKISVLSNIVSSQIELHAPFGGVVPNLAAREHLKNIIPVLKSALENAQIDQHDIDLISVTQGPGLIPALLIGTNFAKTLAYAWHKPLLGIHHIEGHIYANFIDNPHIKFPALALVVSGGHTQLVLVKKHLQYELIGETQDDAVGEAFDKVARILGLSYPGGPIISALAEKYLIENHETNGGKLFPRPMLKSGNFNFSFSGLKTAVLYKVRDFRKENNLTPEDELPQDFIQKMAYEFQEAATDVLIGKAIQASAKYKVQTIFLAGGVSANQSLRNKLGLAVKKSIPQVDYTLQPINYSTDNATMIAVAGAYRFEKMTPSEKLNSLENWKNLEPSAQLAL